MWPNGQSHFLYSSRVAGQYRLSFIAQARLFLTTALGHDSRRVAGRTIELFYVRHWLVLALCVLLPALKVLSWLAGRRKRIAGHCPACGYDMRANPARCSECGTSVSTNARNPNAE